ncbi:MAG: hypothetical protein CL587_17300 [Alteromonadaceae bacterium]|nr:hypothetical protein [Alteromonadaceae bacterium]
MDKDLLYKIGSSQFVRLPEDFRFESMLEFDINESGSTVSVLPAIRAPGFGVSSKGVNAGVLSHREVMAEERHVPC